MKKLLLLLAAVGMMMTSCAEGGGLEENNDNPTEQPSGGNEDDNTEKPVFEIDAEGSYTIPAEGAVIEVTVTTNLEYRVEVSEDAKAWLSIGNTRAVRTETLVFTVAKNESDRERTATITIFNKDDEKVFEFRLTQEFNDKEEIPENIFFGTDKENISISPDGGSAEIVVYSNYKWEVSGTSDWCTPSVKNGEANEDGQKLTFSADVAYDDREATFWLRCADEKIKITVTQAFKETIIPDENNTFNIPAEGGIATIAYQTTIDCEVIIPEEAKEWITIAPATRGLVSESINLNVAENTTYSSRTAVVKVVAKDNANLVVEYTINQEQNDAILADENNTFTVPSEGGNVTIDYQTNVECEVIIPEEAKEWITIAPATRGLVSESANLNIAENTTYSARTATVKVVAKDNANLVVEYTINQEQNDAFLADENNTFTVPSEGGNVTIDYQTNVECEVIIPKAAQKWIWVANTRALVSESVKLYVAENTTYSARTATVKVVAKDNSELFAEYTINQEQNDGILAVNSQVFNVGYRENSITIKHQTNVDCEVIIPEEAKEWITIAPKTRGLKTYSTTLNISANNSDAKRSAVVKVVTKNNSELFVKYTINQNLKCVIEYTSSNGKVVTPYKTNAFDATIFSNTYENGVGIIEFDSPITKIGKEAFRECDFLKGIIIPDGVTEIAASAFYESGLDWVIIPNSVTKIGEYAFYGCVGLSSATIPNSVTSIEDYAFAGCSLTSVTIPNSVTKIGYSAFAGCDPTSVTIPNSVTEIGGRAFCNCSQLTSVTIPNSVTSIGSSAFEGCSKLTSVTIGNGVTRIESSAFRDCSSLSQGVVNISDIAAWCNIQFDMQSSNPLFYAGCLLLNNKKVTHLTIPDGVTSIGNYAFAGCWSITRVTIPNSVTKIGTWAFTNCEQLETVYCKATTPPSLGEHAFHLYREGKYGINYYLKIYVPTASVNAYYSANNWSDYTSSHIVGYDFE